VLTWATTAVATIAAIILVWSIYENWTQNPDRFSWFAALFKALRVGLVAVVAFNAAQIVGFFITAA
jgi:alkylhydroperoxidase family enzyme